MRSQYGCISRNAQTLTILSDSVVVDRIPFHGFHIVASQPPKPAVMRHASLVNRIALLADHLRPSIQRTMSTPTASTTSAPAPLRVLLLHGYTQSGPLFSAKTRALHKAFQKAFSPRPVHFSYPTGPIRLQPTDVPGFSPDQLDAASQKGDKEEVEAYGWWRRKDCDDGTIVYKGMEEGLAAVAKCINEEGPFDGVIGFSQGAAAAGIVASLLEGEHRLRGFEEVEKKGGMNFPDSFREKDGFVQTPMKFAVVYSGFRAPGEMYDGFYIPKITTRVLHFIGQLDTVVEEERSRVLVASCEEERVVVHPGGHFLPSQRPWLDACVGFVKEALETGETTGKKEEEERVEDMDVPF